MASKTDYDAVVRKRRMTVRGGNKAAKAIDEAVGKAGKAEMKKNPGDWGKTMARSAMENIEYPEVRNLLGTRTERKKRTMKDREDPGYKKGGAVKSKPAKL